MARIPLITSRELVPEDKRHIVDEIAKEHGKVTGSWPVLLYAPEMAGRIAHLGAYVRYGSELPFALRELATLAIARELDSEYTWGGHVPQAIKAGVREQAIQVIATRGDVDGLTQEEAVVVTYVRELLRTHRVSQSTFSSARELFGEAGLVEFTARIGYYCLLASTLNAFEVKGEELIYRTTDQDGMSEGQERWFCTACMKAFPIAKGQSPTVCPEGHRTDDSSLTASIQRLPL